MKPSERLYLRYEYLASRYASRIFSYHELSFEYEDLLQEFRQKIFTSIKAYGRRWSFYRTNGYNKPVPIKYYLEAACANMARDFMKLITRENHKMRIDDLNYDYGYEDTSTSVNLESNQFMLNGVDLLDGLDAEQRFIFSSYLKGYPKQKIAIVYSNKVKTAKDRVTMVDEVIRQQIDKLKTIYGADLMKAAQRYESYRIDD